MSSYIMVGILAVLFLPAALFVTYRIFRFVWSSDKIIPLMLIMLTLTIMSMLSYYMFLICQQLFVKWSCYNNQVDQCLTALIPNLPSFFLALAVILNLNKWVYFQLRICAFIRIGKKATALQDMSNSQRSLIPGEAPLRNQSS